MLLVGIWRDIKPLEKGQAVSYKNELYLSYDSASPLKNTNLREMKMYIHKDLYINSHSSFIHNSPKLETQKSISIQIDKQIMNVIDYFPLSKL